MGRCHLQHARGMIVFLPKQVKINGFLGSRSSPVPQEFQREASMQSEIPKIKQESRGLSANKIDIYSNLIILLPATGAELKTLPYGGEIARSEEHTSETQVPVNLHVRLLL